MDRRSKWLLMLLVLAATAAAGVVQVLGQTLPDSTGFISIDCGLPEQTGSYVDDLTKLQYTSDAGFTDAGSNHNVSAEHIDPAYTKRYPQALNVRAFSGSPRSCYTLPSAVPGTTKFLVRAVFMYGNYDGLNRIPIFDLYLGVNFWETVNVSTASTAYVSEVIAVIPDKSVQVCLVDTGSGTPFISWLELRPLKNTLYPQANATQAIVLFHRDNFGATTTVRYPDDPYDRAWFIWEFRRWWPIRTYEMVYHDDESSTNLFQPPSTVMQTGIIPLNVSEDIRFSYVVRTNHVYPKPRYTFVLYFSEVEVLASNAVRMLSVLMNGMLLLHSYKPRYLISDTVYTSEPVEFSDRYNFTIIAMVPNSTLPPIINAVEVFSIISTANVGTFAQDAFAIAEIKKTYKAKKNWEGDPCSPRSFAWDGLNCSYPISSPPRITNINLSFSGLSGNISTYFASLKAIQYLDLSHNKLTGSVPLVLSELSSLTVLDLTDNELSGSIPPGLLKRVEDGSLTLRYGDNPSLCNTNISCNPAKKNSKLAVYVALPLGVVVIIGLLIVLLLTVRKRRGSTKGSVEVQSVTSDVQSHDPSSDGRSLLQLDNRRFTYRELEAITNNFHRVLGRGGFGIVYAGLLEDGTQVAVKLRSQSSNQGVTEFLAEARNLTRIHHKNLVSLIGYCKDGDYLALVYEYMSEGNLQNKLRRSDPNIVRLTWRQRLHIALESAQGLEYLHKSCSPPFLHRDVKTSNILLNANLKAKVADFGLLKAFNRDDDTHASTARVVGTQGYLAPEYAANLQLTEKSDVYSFGIVLLEVITGQPPILQTPEPASIVDWARKRLEKGNIEDVVDTCMRGDYDINSVWKAMTVALTCTVQIPARRYTMTEVVSQLQECLELEESHTTTDDTNNSFTSGSGGGPNSSYGAYAINPPKMEHHFGRAMGTGPSTR